MTDDVLISAAGGILRIVLNRPDHGNALTPPMTEAIARAVTAPDPAIRVILITANGPDFCTGRAAAMPAKGTQATANDLRAMISDPVLAFYDTLRTAPVPVLALVQGRAAGVGCAVAALADVAVAGAGATFVVPEMTHDIAPTLVMDALVDRVPRATLARLVLTRDPVSADQAQAMALIGKVVPDADLGAEGERLATQLAANSAPTVRAIKAFLMRAPESSHATRRELAALLNATATAEKFR
jgi:enoyl-CoA hydratase